jgi:hypothetical protein
LRVHTCFGQGEERVEELESALVQIDEGTRVHRTLLVEIHAPRPVKGTLHVPESVGLEEVPMFCIHDEPAHDEHRIELKVLHGPSEA